jgi:hypothetical protein
MIFNIYLSRGAIFATAWCIYFRMIRIIPAEMRKARPEHQLSALREKANSGYRDFGGLKDKNQANLRP